MGDSAVLTRLKMLLKEDKLVEKYIARHGEELNIAYIKAIKEEAEQSSLVDDLQNLDVKPLVGTEEVTGIGEDPIYENKLICPVCKNHNVVSYNLRAKSQFITESLFMVPLYAGLSKYRKESFTKIQTTVCTQCLFASPDPKDFSKFIEYTGKTVNSQLLVHRKLLFHLEDTTQERMVMMNKAGITINDFKRPRSVDAAIFSIRLSIFRAQAEKTFDLSNTLFKVGSYYLRIAQLQKESNIDNTESLQSAFENLESAVLDSDIQIFELEMEALYLVLSLAIKLGDKEKMSAFFKLTTDSLSDVKAEVTENPNSIQLKKKFATADKWEKKSKTSLEYRDDETYWQDV